MCFPSASTKTKDAIRGKANDDEDAVDDAGYGSPVKGPDSGAVIVGVVSFGTQTCDKKGWPGVFTSVAYHSEWIKQYI